MPTLVPALQDRCVVVNGVAKTYAMTGWRVGGMIGPAYALKHPERVLSLGLLSTAASTGGSNCACASDAK